MYLKRALLLPILALLAACGQQLSRDAITPPGEGNVAALNISLDQSTVLYGQSLPMPASLYLGYGSSDNQNPSSAVRSADDINVPAGDPWLVRQIFFQGINFSFPLKPINNFNVFVYENILDENGNGKPGAEIAAFTHRNVPAVENLNDAGVGLIFDYLLTLDDPLVLPPGKYWLTVQASLLNETPSDFSWLSTYIVSGDEAHAYYANSDTCNNWCTFTNNGARDLVYSLVGMRLPSLVLYPTGSVNRSSGQAAVNGTISCVMPQIPTLKVEVRQRQGKTLVQGTTNILAPCDGAKPWAAAVRPTKGSFKSGQAEVAVEVVGSYGKGSLLQVVSLK